MNNILAVSAKLKSSSIAVQFENGIFETEYQNDTPTYLVSNIKKTLSTIGLGVLNLEQFLICNGPGSFTAIRTIISIAKAFREVSQVRVATASVFDIFYNLYSAEILEKNACLIIKSENSNEVYVQTINRNGDKTTFASYKENLKFQKEFDVVLTDIESSNDIDILRYSRNVICDKDIRNARNILKISKNIDMSDSLEAFYVKPPYVVAKL